MGRSSYHTEDVFECPNCGAENSNAPEETKDRTFLHECGCETDNEGEVFEMFMAEPRDPRTPCLCSGHCVSGALAALREIRSAADRAQRDMGEVEGEQRAQRGYDGLARCAKLAALAQQPATERANVPELVKTARRLCAALETLEHVENDETHAEYTQAWDALLTALEPFEGVGT